MSQQAYSQYYQPKKKKVPAWVWWLLGILVFVALVVVLAIAVNRQQEEAGSGLLPVGDSEYLAVLRVEGTMTADSSTTGYSYTASTYDQQYLLETLEALSEDENNQGLLLYIDSPGGEVLAASDLADAVVAYKEATGRPVYAYGHGYAASGGYWLAAAADRFFVNRYCITGSIGVTYGTMFDFSGLLEKYGVKATSITSGAQKSMGSSWEEMTPETRAIFQSIIDEYYGYFLDWVCAQRGMDQEYLKTLADGRIYTAVQAVDNGLADEVGDYDDCLAALQELAGPDLEVVELSPELSTNLFDLLMQTEAQRELNSILSLAQPSGILAYCEY
ncbi:MAG: signal peptide peptidase SppA [Firmicutes bacterium]|nr:signal peptide peptidase SppA [Bacillota bacterium]